MVPQIFNKKRMKVSLTPKVTQKLIKSPISIRISLKTWGSPETARKSGQKIIAFPYKTPKTKLSLLNFPELQISLLKCIQTPNPFFSSRRSGKKDISLSDQLDPSTDRLKGNNRRLKNIVFRWICLSHFSSSCFPDNRPNRSKRNNALWICIQTKIVLMTSCPLVWIKFSRAPPFPLLKSCWTPLHMSPSLVVQVPTVWIWPFAEEESCLISRERSERSPSWSKLTKPVSPTNLVWKLKHLI